MNKIARKIVFLFSIIAVFLLFVIPASQISKELYFVNFVGLNSSMKSNRFLESMSAQLPIDNALLFVDEADHFGYVFFEKLEYFRATYVLVIFNSGKKTEQRGALTKWSCFPWKRLTARDGAIYFGDEVYPHFVWVPINGLGYRHSKIKQVSMVPITELQTICSQTQTNAVKWIQTGEHDM